MAERYLSTEEARAFYDRFGKRQDWQRFYEGPALRNLLFHGVFGAAYSVFELGCGTGAFAKTLLENYLPETATYAGVDISSTMVRIARERLSAFKDRIEVEVTDGTLSFNYPDGSFDRLVSNYVMDLLSPGDIRKALSEAKRVLKSGGLLCLVSLTHGRLFVSRAVTWAWLRIFAHDPSLVGGCRPLQLKGYLDEDRWQVEYRGIIQAFGIPSEVLIASKRAG